MRWILVVLSLQSSLAWSSAFSIEDAISQTLIYSPRLRQIDAERQAQTEKKRGAWSDLGPRVKSAYNEVRFTDELTGSFSGQTFILRPNKSKIGNIQIVQPVIGIYPLYAWARLQGHLEDLAVVKTDMVTRDLAFEAADTWLKAYQSEKQVSVAEAAIRAAEKQWTDAQALERVGRLNHGDVLKLQVLLFENRSRAAQARAMREIAFAQLRELVGLSSKTELKLQDQLPTPVKKTVEKNDDFIKANSEKRLEMIQAEGLITNAEYGKKVALAGFGPSVNVFAQIERNFGDLSVFGQTNRDTKSYGIQATWELWNSGSTSFAVREASQKIVQAEETKRETEIAVRMELVASFANVDAAQESFELAKLAMQQAEEAYRIETVKFASGSSSASDLILAESSATGSKIRLLTAETDLISWNLKLQKSLGENRPQFEKK